MLNLLDSIAPGLLILMCRWSSEDWFIFHTPSTLLALKSTELFAYCQENGTHRCAFMTMIRPAETNVAASSALVVSVVASTVLLPNDPNHPDAGCALDLNHPTIRNMNEADISSASTTRNLKQAVFKDLIPCDS